MVKCGTKSCNHAAVATVYWPGQTLPMCHSCGLRATGVANAMGLTLTVEALEEPVKVVQVLSLAQVFGG